MSWDPAESLRGDIPEMSPLDRARLFGADAEVREERDRLRRQAERRAEIEAAVAQRTALDRAQKLARGYTDAELQEFNAEREAAQAERIAELEAQLDRLDPKRRRVQAQRQRDAQDAALLVRARQPDEFMQRQVAELERRRQDDGDRRYRAREDDLARLRESGYIAEIIR